MPASASPSISSTTLTCHEPAYTPSNTNMRLPSMEELLRKTDRLSERSRTYGHVTSPSTNLQMSSQGFIDLTSDLSASSFHLPSFQHFSDTSLPSTSFYDAPYSSIADMPPRTARRSREPTITRERPIKRRRRNEFNEGFASRPSSSQSTNEWADYHSKPIDILDLTTPYKEEEKGNQDSIASTLLQEENEEEVASLVPENIGQIEQQNEQDKQLADTIRAQTDQAQGSLKLNQLTCIICMDNMVDMTATICGHLFCHKCITDALIHGENQADGRSGPKCPMCRTKLRRKVTKGHADIVPLNLMLMKRSDKAKGKQKQVL